MYYVWEETQIHLNKVLHGILLCRISNLPGTEETLALTSTPWGTKHSTGGGVFTCNVMSYYANKAISSSCLGT